MRLYQTKKLPQNKQKSMNKMKKQPTEWEIMFANSMSDEKLVSKI